MDVIGCKDAGFVQDEEFFLLQILLLQTPQQFTKGCYSFPVISGFISARGTGPA